MRPNEEPMAIPFSKRFIRFSKLTSTKALYMLSQCGRIFTRKIECYDRTDLNIVADHFASSC